MTTRARQNQPEPTPMRYRAPWREHEAADGYTPRRDTSEATHVRDMQIKPGSWDPETRTLDVVWTTGARVRRYDAWTGEEWDEELSLDPQHVRLGRLNSGAPLLDSHWSYGTSSVIGVVVDGSARVENGVGTATVRLSAAPGDADITSKIADGIIRSVSVGYQIHSWMEVNPERERGETPVWRAVDWEPFEISAVGIPADAGAGFRSGAGRNNPQEEPMKVRGGRGRRAEEEVEETCECAGEEGCECDEAAEEAPVVKTESDARAQREAERRGAEAERARIAGIQLAARTLRLEAEGAKLIDEGVSLAKAQSRLFELAAQADDALGIKPHVRVEAGTTESEKQRSAIENALLHRFDPAGHKLDAGREFVGMSLLEIGRRYVERHGRTFSGSDRYRQAGEILSFRSGGMHHSSDWSILLSNVAGKTLRKAYVETPSQWQAFCRQTNLPDYKEVTRIQLGEAPSLEPIPELGEYTYATVGEGSTSWKIHKAGRMLGFSREAMVNDDLNGFLRLFQLFGSASARYQADRIYEIITGNAVMSDGVALFHANHNNLLSSMAPSLDAIDAMDQALGLQRGLDGVAELNLTLAYILTPRKHRLTFRQLVSGKVAATQAGEVIPDEVSDLRIISDSRLDRNNSHYFYGIADPSQIDTIEHGFLEGVDGPVIETQEGFEVDGIKWKCRLEWGCKAIDYRGFVKVAYDGTSPSQGGD